LGQVSVTFDGWTSKPTDPYLGVTGHWISAPADQPTEWSLQSKVLGLVPIEGCHTGANMAATLLSVIDRYDLRAKVCISGMSFFLYLISDCSLAGLRLTMRR
jgi:hypothetical protein